MTPKSLLLVTQSIDTRWECAYSIALLGDNTAVICGKEKYEDSEKFKSFDLNTGAELDLCHFENGYYLAEVKMGEKLAVAVSYRSVQGCVIEI